MSSNALILFGITGDLGKKKLLPALVQLARAGILDGPVIGVGRTDLSDEDLWDMVRDATGSVDAELQAALDLRYVVGDSQETTTFDELAERTGGSDSPIVYAALPPNLFAGVARGIAQSRLPKSTRFVVEKPFGDDRSSALELFEEITSLLPAENVFAVDHFLAKAEVENLAPFRYRNPLIDAAFDARSVDRIEVTMSEAFGVDGRGSFYESVGALRDVVQNHLLQMIAVLMMEEPADDSPAAFDEARAELLHAMLPLGADDVVLGQFAGYRDLDDVADDSNVETFVAARLEVDNDRWRGVEIALRTGKELGESCTEIVVHMGSNRVRFGIKPDPAIVLELDVAGQATQLVACAPTGHRAGVRDETGTDADPGSGGAELGDYATMLAGALAGNQRHFARIGDIVRAWEIIDAVLDRDEMPDAYEAGTWGPASAKMLLGVDADR